MLLTEAKGLRNGGRSYCSHGSGAESDAPTTGGKSSGQICEFFKMYSMSLIYSNDILLV